MTNDIFDFNHISPNLIIEQELELKSYYQNCHLKCFLYKKAFQHYKKIKYGCRFISILITAGGIASVIATEGVLGILAAIPGIAIEILMDYKNVHNNIISGAPAARRATQRSPIGITGRKRKPMKDFPYGYHG